MNTKSTKLLPVALAAGVLGLSLRLLLYRTGFDEWGILSDTHPLHIACLILAIAAGVYLALQCRKPELEPESVGPLRLRLLCAFGACGLLTANAFTFPHPLSGALNMARLLLCFGCAFSIVVCACREVGGKAAGLVCHGLICVYFGVDMLCRYQVWSGNPQLPDYCFHILACVFLTLSAYHRLAFDTGLGKARSLRFTSLMALLLCLLSTVGPDPWQFFLGGACFACVNLLLPLPRAKESTEPEEA